MSNHTANVQRNGSLDYARLIAAFCIVLFHAGAPGAWYGYAALPFFLLVLMMLGSPAAARQNFSTFLKSRARRLLVPWGVWSLVFGILKLAEVILLHKPFASEFPLWVLLTGPALHLWFLPFAFVACLLTYPLVRLTALQNRVLLIVLLSVCTFLALGLLNAGPWQIPLAQWIQAMPAVFIGLLFGIATGPRDRIVVAIALTGVAVIAIAMAWTAGLLHLALAISALGLCILLPTQATPLSDLSAKLALTVYPTFSK